MPDPERLAVAIRYQAMLEAQISKPLADILRVTQAKPVRAAAQQPLGELTASPVRVGREHEPQIEDATVRGGGAPWFAARAPSDQRRVFTGAANEILYDLDVALPRRRKYVLPPFKPFVYRDPLSGQSIALPGAAIEQVRACPPLGQAFTRAAFRARGTLQTRLVIDQTLLRAERRRIHRELALLVCPGRPTWESWVRLTPNHLHGKFDRLVSGWLDAPPGPGEERWFTPGWCERLSLGAAEAFFAGFSPEVLAFLGIESNEC